MIMCGLWTMLCCLVILFNRHNWKSYILVTIISNTIIPDLFIISFVFLWENCFTSWCLIFNRNSCFSVMLDTNVSECMINGALPSRPKSAYYAYLPQQIFALMKTSFVCLQKASSRFLHQDEYIRLSHTSLEDAFKISSRRLDQDQYIRLGHTSSRRFKMSCKNVFKTSSRRLQNTL